MVKNIFIIIVGSFMLTSCCDLIGLQGGGVRSKRLYKRYVDFDCKPPSWIDTTVVYRKLYDSTYYGNGEYSIYSDTTHPTFMKFFDKGRYADYLIRANEKGKLKLSASSFALNKAFLGYYKIKTGSVEMYTYHPSDCGTFFKMNLLQTSDENKIMTAFDGNHFSFYERVEVPVEWLPQKPDW